MLKFSVGYQYKEDMPFSEMISRFSDSMDEVYFPWIDLPSGRSIISGYEGYYDYGLQNNLLNELKTIKSMGIKLDLLFNANCYGEEAMSCVMRGKVYSIIDFLNENDLSPDVVTTTSPAIARKIKERYDNIILKASVNMKISTVKGMEYISHLFDDYCIA